MEMDWSTYGWLLGIVALASLCQNLTGFAFGLLFVGLAGALHLMPIADAANVASLLALINSAIYLRSHPFEPRCDVLKPIGLSCIAGVVVGWATLQWLSGDMVGVLRSLLGITIIGCAVLLLLQKTKRQTLSGTASMWVAGGLSGVLGGLFSTSGPPMVFHLYRQPLSALVVRQCLQGMFLCSTVVRLVLVVPTGGMSMASVVTACTALPVVVAVTWLLAKYPPQLPTRVLQWMVCTLLVLAGVSMLVT